MSDLREALKECPFCGKPPVFLSISEDDSFIRCYEVRCDNCGIGLSEEYRDDTVKLWNTRAALAQPEAGELSRYSFGDCHIGTINSSGMALDKRLVERPEGLTNIEWYRFAGSIIRLLNTTPPIAPDGERMRRALERTVKALSELRDAVERSGKLNGRDYVSLGIHVNNAIDDARQALSRADEGKYDPKFVEAIKAADDAEPEATFSNVDDMLGHLSADEGKESEGGLERQARNPVGLPDGSGDLASAGGIARDDITDHHRQVGSNAPSDSTPQDATAQREAIARIIRGIYGMGHLPFAGGRQDKSIESAADRILALQTRAGG